MSNHENGLYDFLTLLEGPGEVYEGAQADLEEIQSIRDQLQNGGYATKKSEEIAHRYVRAARRIAAPFN